jgi:hypothetical protein
LRLPIENVVRKATKLQQFSFQNSCTVLGVYQPFNSTIIDDRIGLPTILVIENMRAIFMMRIADKSGYCSYAKDREKRLILGALKWQDL